MRFTYDHYSITVFPGPASPFRVLVSSGSSSLVYEDRQNQTEALKTGARLVAVLAKTTTESVLMKWGVAATDTAGGAELYE